MKRGHKGFTLIELLIAVSLMAVLAVLGWRGLDSVLSSRERIVAVSDSLRSLSVGFSQIDEDLRQAWPVRLRSLPVPPIGFAVEGTDAAPVLQLVREYDGDLVPPQLQRVIYRVRDGVFERGFSVWVNAAVGLGDALGQQGGQGGQMSGQQGGEQIFTWQPLLDGVTQVQMRGWIDGQGWVAASALATRAPNTSPASLVTGLEIVIARGSERVVRIFTVRD